MEALGRAWVHSSALSPPAPASFSTHPSRQVPPPQKKHNTKPSPFCQYFPQNTANFPTAAHLQWAGGVGQQEVVRDPASRHLNSSLCLPPASIALFFLPSFLSSSQLQVGDRPPRPSPLTWGRPGSSLLGPCWSKVGFACLVLRWGHWWCFGWAQEGRKRPSFSPFPFLFHFLSPPPHISAQLMQVLTSVSTRQTSKRLAPKSVLDSSPPTSNSSSTGCLLKPRCEPPTVPSHTCTRWS